MNNPLTVFVLFFKREWLLQLRQPRLLLNSCLFFLMFLCVFPLGQSYDVVLLHNIAPGLTWIAMLLASLVSADRLLQQDYEQGIIEQWLLSGNNLACLLCAKVLAHWLINFLPIVLCCPFIALLFGLNGTEIAVLIASLLCGTPALLFLCALAAAFSLGLNQRAAFMALIVLPLTLPLLIFGAGLVAIAVQGLPYSGYLALLLAMSLFSVGLLPFAMSGVIRLSQEA